MKLDRDDVHRIAGETGDRQSPPLRVVGVTGAHDGTYTEVLFAQTSAAAGPPVLIGVFRDASEDTLRDAIQSKLDVAVRG